MTEKLPPFWAVRQALGLSSNDVRIISHDTGVDTDAIDHEPIEALGVLADTMNNYHGQMRLTILNPDNTVFKQWDVTTDGYLQEIE